MHLVRGRGETIAADRAATRDLLARAADGEPALRVWCPHRQVAFGRRDTNAEGYESARRVARKRGYEPIERSVGGRAVVYSGRTLSFAHALPLDDPRTGLEDRYEAALAAVRGALRGLGAGVERGEPPDAFCPGSHSLRGSPPAFGSDSDPGRSRDGDPAEGKLCGIAQRIRQEAALVAGCVLVDDHRELTDAFDRIYSRLGVPFSPDSVGSVTAAGGPNSPARVARALERAFVGDDPVTIDRLPEESPAGLRRQPG